MKHRFTSLLLFATATLSALTPALQAQGDTQPEVNFRALRAHTAVKSATAANVDAMKAHGSGHLPTWSFLVQSPRDNNSYTGVMVGQDPYNGGRSTAVPTQIVPLIIVTHTITTSIDKTGNITTVPGTTTFDPTAPDHGCLTAPNNVPLTLFQQSPVLQPATFDFGGTVVGHTQYVDAFQRASFWRALGQDRDDYHLTLAPVRTLAPRVIDVPAPNGTAIPASFPPKSCSPQAIVDLYWLDDYLANVVLPALAKDGVAPSTFPIFLLYNVVMDLPPAANISTCCVIGYHSGNGLPVQTYAVADFDTTGLLPLAYQDSATLSHEVAEWANDPYGNNQTPAWGNTGQVIGACQQYLEVGDPLSGNEAPRISMPNGFTYHLQEMAFFSWFYGLPSTGVNGWFSNNGTFLANAGAPCEQPSASSAVSGWIIR